MSHNGAKCYLKRANYLTPLPAPSLRRALLPGRVSLCRGDKLCVREEPKDVDDVADLVLARLREMWGAALVLLD